MDTRAEDAVVDERLLAEYAAKLSALHYDTVGSVEALVLSPRPDEHVPVLSLRVIPYDGPEGQYPGKQWWRGARVPGRQISAVNAEVLDALEIPYPVPGDNLIIRGFDLSRLEPGDVLRIGDAFLRATPTPHRPCTKLARRTSPTKKEAMTAQKYRGTLFDAVHPATIHLGDAVERIQLSESSTAKPPH